jgi:hypothetical protein
MSLTLLFSSFFVQNELTEKLNVRVIDRVSFYFVGFVTVIETTSFRRRIGLVRPGWNKEDWFVFVPCSRIAYDPCISVWVRPEGEDGSIFYVIFCGVSEAILTIFDVEVNWNFTPNAVNLRRK